MCGGGGGGDGGAGDREKARQKRIKDATDAVNQLFGVGPKTALMPTGEKRVTKYERKGTQMVSNPDADFPMATPTTETLSPEEYLKLQSAPKKKFGGTNLDGFKPIYEDVMAEQTTDAARAADARDALYKQVGADTRDYFSKQLGEDAEDALRDKRFTEARNGTFGSSQALDMQRAFDRRNDRGLLDVANRSDQAATNLRSNDEKTRIDLISRIVNGADQDSATSSALSQLQTNADAARNEAQSGRMANVFSGALDAWKAYQTGAGQEAARKQFESQYGNFFANNGSGGGYQGSVTR